MAMALVYFLGGILIAGVLLYVRGMVRERRCNEEFTQLMARRPATGRNDGTCTWIVHDDGSFSCIFRKRLPSRD